MSDSTHQIGQKGVYGIPTGEDIIMGDTKRLAALSGLVYELRQAMSTGEVVQALVDSLRSMDELQLAYRVAALPLVIPWPTRAVEDAMTLVASGMTYSAVSRQLEGKYRRKCSPTIVRRWANGVSAYKATCLSCGGDRDTVASVCSACNERNDQEGTL